MDNKHIEDQLTALSEVAHKNKETTERLESNWDKDRKDQADLINRVGHLEVEQKALKEEVNNVPPRVKDEVRDIVKPLQNQVETLTKELTDFKEILIKKKIIAVDQGKTQVQVKKRHWYFLWLA